MVVDDASRPSSCHRAGGRPDGRSPPVPLPRPAPGTAKWWVVGIVGCLARHGPRRSGGAWPARSARSPGPTSATRTRRPQHHGDVRRPPAGRPRRVLRRAGPGQPATAPVGAVTVADPGRRAGARCTGHDGADHHQGRDRRGQGLQRPALAAPSAAQTAPRRPSRAESAPFRGSLVRLVFSHRGSGPRDLHRSGSGPASLAPAAAPAGAGASPLTS